MRRRVLRICFVSVLVLTALPDHAQTPKRIDVEPGKFLALRGYVVQHDTLVCRTPQKERQLALTLRAALATADELQTLKEIAERHQEEIELYKRIVARKDFVIQKQDSLLHELETLLEPQKPSLLRTLGKLFDRRTFFLLGFVAGVFAGVNVPGN